MAKSKATYGTENARGTFCIVPQRCVHDTRLQHRPKTLLCLLAIANYCNKMGYAFPNQKTIAKDLNITQSTVSKHIKLLIEYGYIRYATKKFNKALSYRSNAYFMVFDPSITEDDARAIQNTKDLEEIDKQDVNNLAHIVDKSDNIPSNRIPNIPSERLSNRDINRDYIVLSKKIINEFKKILEQTYGHIIIWKLEDQDMVSRWLSYGHSKEYITKRIRSTLEWRKANGKDSIKRITYFDKVFTPESGPKTKRDQLGDLINKFGSTNKIKW
jgi:DNA-binding Lrp family transcriptional regulator